MKHPVVSIDFRIFDITQAIERNPSQHVSELARLVNLSTSRLSHLFKAKMGVSLRTFIAERRLETAAELLRSTDLRVKEISYRLGYGQEPSFTRAFKKKYRLTPLAYRHDQRQQPDARAS